MDTSFSEAIQAFSDSPALQGTLAALCTFILEDPATLAWSLLAAGGKMLYATALIGLTLGIGLIGLLILMQRRSYKRYGERPPQLNLFGRGPSSIGEIEDESRRRSRIHVLERFISRLETQMTA